jgi:hypothetical protein
MSNRTASRLDPGLIARKGQAVPAAPVPEPPGPIIEPAARIAVPLPPTAANGPTPEDAGRQPAARGVHGTIAVTVRLDPARYERLKVHGARVRRTNQEILVEALDDYFRSKA